jgi:glutamate/tyrosine decarboxylase-like PLP-dependent enzyme
LGYTVTGTEDNIASLQDIISNFESSHQDCRVFVWVDASLAGISKIYLENSFRPFAYSKVQLITTDFHKFLAVPYPASMLLYRRNLIEYIERQIPYFDQIDSTLLGSRPGLNVLAAWLTLLNLNPEKGKNIFTKKLKEKKDFLKKIMVVDSKIKIVTHPTSLQAGVILNGISNKSILALKNKYKLHPFKYTLNLQGGKKVVKICKLYFFPDFELKKHE